MRLSHSLQSGFLSIVVTTACLLAGLACQASAAESSTSGLNLSSGTVLIDFWADYCVPCHKMTPVVQRLASQGYPVKKIDFERERALADRFQVDQIPTFIMLRDGQVVDRHVGTTSEQRLRDMFDQAGFQLEQSRSSTEAAGSFAGSSLPSVVQPFATQNVATGLAGRPGAAFERSDASRSSTSAKNVLSGLSETDRHLVASTVRLRIHEPNGNLSIGTGTVIDSRAGAALILTCAHIFVDERRDVLTDADGKWNIDVELFHTGYAQLTKGVLISYDLKSDVGLVRIMTDQTIPHVRVAQPGFAVQVGDPVINVGCNHGDDPTVRHNVVTAIDKYLGPPNIEVAGLPVQGRSGGGLFSENGYVIGVCNAADPADNEGLYAGLASIQAELDRESPTKKALTFVYMDQDTAAGTGGETSLAGATSPDLPRTMPRSPVQWPIMANNATRPNSPRFDIADPNVLPVANNTIVNPANIAAGNAPLQPIPTSSSSRDSLTADQVATLNQIRDRMLRGDQIVVLACPRDQMEAAASTDAQLIVLDRDSQQAIHNSIGRSLGGTPPTQRSFARNPSGYLR